MRERIKLSGWLEWDALTNWRKVLIWRPGKRKAAKRSYNRRLRQRARQRCQGKDR